MPPFWGWGLWRSADFVRVLKVWVFAFVPAQAWATGRSFQEEYRASLKRYGVDFGEQYVWG